MYKSKVEFVSWRVWAAVLLTILLSACGRGGAVLEINPPSADGVDCKRMVVLEVSWDVREFGLKGGYLEVNNLGEAPKLWTRIGEYGNKMTGAWARDGFTVILRATNGVELARRTYICPYVTVRTVTH